MSFLPAYNPEFFRVDDPALPALNPNDLYSLIPMDKKRTYDIYDVIGRLFDKSQFLEYKKGYGPEIVAGLAKAEGLLVGRNTSWIRTPTPWVSAASCTVRA